MKQITVFLESESPTLNFNQNVETCMLMFNESSQRFGHVLFSVEFEKACDHWVPHSQIVSIVAFSGF